MTAPFEPPVCVRHPEQKAELVCTRCGRWQCERCVRPLTQGSSGPRGCAHCDGIVKWGELARVPDSHQQLLMRLLTAEGLFTIAALSLPAMAMSTGSPFSVVMAVIYGGVVAGYFFQTVGHVARHLPGLPFSSHVGSAAELGGMLARGLGVFLVSFGPALLTRLLLPSWSWLSWALACLGLAVAPASVLAGVVSQNAVNQLWPLAWYEVVARAPRSFLSLCAWSYGSLPVVVGLELAIAHAAAGVGVLGRVLGSVLLTSYLVWLATLFGRHLQIEGERSYGLRY